MQATSADIKSLYLWTKTDASEQICAITLQHGAGRSVPDLQHQALKDRPAHFQ